LAIFAESPVAQPDANTKTETRNVLSVTPPGSSYGTDRVAFFSQSSPKAATAE
jgi:hypothetical protein